MRERGRPISIKVDKYSDEWYLGKRSIKHYRNKAGSYPELEGNKGVFYERCN